MGLDVTRLTSAERRRAQHLLSLVRTDLRTNAHEYSQLAGHLVTIWFTEAKFPGSGLPPARADATTRDLMLERLRILDPDRSQRIPRPFRDSKGLGEPHLMTGPPPGLRLLSSMRVRGHLGLLDAAPRERHLGRDRPNLLDHDYEGADRLVILVGSPAAPYGEVSGADHLLWDFVAASGSWPEPPHLEHIRRVDVHDGGRAQSPESIPMGGARTDVSKWTYFTVRRANEPNGEAVGWQIQPFPTAPAEGRGLALAALGHCHSARTLASSASA